MHAVWIGGMQFSVQSRIDLTLCPIINKYHTTTESHVYSSLMKDVRRREQEDKKGEIVDIEEEFIFLVLKSRKKT